MEKLRFRCHFSIIFESLWQFWLVIFFIAINEVDSLIELAQDFDKEEIYEFIESGGLVGILVILIPTLIVLTIQFLRWRKTWITIEDNLIIIERNTLNKVKNTIAIENISAVNMERNLFERLVGTYRIKMDTNSLTTADETDISIVFSEKIAIGFRQLVLERMNTLKGNTQSKALSEERQPDQLFESSIGDRKVFHSGLWDMIKHSFYSLPLFSFVISLAGIFTMIWYVSAFGFVNFVEDALGGFLAGVMVVLASIYNIIKRFITYYDFTAYRDGKDVHVRCGLIKLRSYTIPVDKITALQIEQPFFGRIFKKYSIKVVTVGIGDEEGESSNITMSLSKKELEQQMAELLPEYSWADLGKVLKEEKGALVVRFVKSIKWHILTVFVILTLMFYCDTPWQVGILVPLAVDLVINLLYLLSHKAAGYAVLDQGLILSNGYLNKEYTICTYKKVQYISMTYHPAAKKQGIGDGMVLLLNSAAEIPYIKKDLVYKIEEKILGKVERSTLK